MSFNIANCRRFALFTLGQEPPPHVVRPEPKGLLVASWVLPLELCPTLNRMAEMLGWQRSKIKKQLLFLMRAQLPGRLPMLRGRPMVRAIRFSSRETDPDSAFAKFAIDRLTPKHDGLGLIEDDRGSKLERHEWWEQAPPSSGFVFLQLFTGKEGATK